MVILTLVLLAAGVIGYVLSFAVLCAESDNNIVGIVNFWCVVAFFIGMLLAGNKLMDVECPKCESVKLVSSNVRYCDVCGSKLIPVNEK